MAERKPIGKKLRFEVFKRDSFTCQYCGRSAPDVVLEVDHIQPVADGGKNDILNLITSCHDCNAGKGKRKLSDQQTMQKEKKQLDELQKRREQMDMMIMWKKELLNLTEQQAEYIGDYIQCVTDYSLSDSAKKKIAGLIRRFSFEEVDEAVEIAVNRYYWGSGGSLAVALNKVGGICYNRRYQKKEQVDGNQENSKH